jgi:hypothetical protein
MDPAPSTARCLTLREIVQWLAGKLVRMLLDKANPAAGRRTVAWDLADDTGRALAPGRFIWRVTARGKSESRIVNVR